MEKKMEPEKFKITPEQVRGIYSFEIDVDLDRDTVCGVEFDWSTVNGGLNARWNEFGEEGHTHRKKFTFYELCGYYDPICYLANEAKDIFEEIADRLNEYFKDYRYEGLPI